MQGRPAGQVPTFSVEDLRNVDIDLSDSDILNLGENVSAVSQAFDRVFKLPQNATVSELDRAKGLLQMLNKPLKAVPMLR